METSETPAEPPVEAPAGLRPGHRLALVPARAGKNPRFGNLTAGQPFWTDKRGAELSDTELRELAAGSVALSLVEIPLPA